MSTLMPIPDLPGRLIPRHSEEEKWFKTHIKRMCRMESEWSFEVATLRIVILDFLEASQSVLVLCKDLKKLENQEWVIELCPLAC